MSSPIVIVAGPIGAGKTTVANAMVPLLDGKVARIEGDLFWLFLAKGFGSVPNPGAFRLVMSSMLAAAVPVAANDAMTVLDFSIPPWYLDTARKIAGVRQVPIDYVVVRPPLEECAARAKKRKEGAIADYAQYTDLFRDFDAVEERHLEAGSTSPAEVAARIVEGLKAGRFRLI